MSGVAEVTEPDQGFEQPVVVALVQADGRLVEHVEDAHQPRADLGGQPDPLRLTSGQRRGRAVEGEVVEPDVEQEAEPRVDLLEHPFRDVLVAFGQVQRAAGTSPARRWAWRRCQRSSCRRR